MPKCWPPSSQLRVLKDKARDKCQVCRQAGHWAKHASYNSLSQMPPTGALDSALPLGPESPGVRLQAILCNGPSGLKQPTPASPISQITITELDPRVQLVVAIRSENFFINTRLPTLYWPPTREPSPPQTCAILGAIGKTFTKEFTQALLCCWGGQIFSHQPLWFLSVPLLC